MRENYVAAEAAGPSLTNPGARVVIRTPTAPLPCHPPYSTLLGCAGPKISREQMRDGKVPLGFRDNCAHLLIPLNECVRAYACQHHTLAERPCWLPPLPPWLGPCLGVHLLVCTVLMPQLCHAFGPLGHAAGAGTRRVSCRGAARISAMHTKHASITSMSDASLCTKPRRRVFYKTREAFGWHPRPGWLAPGCR
jgi:hypothetical protein